MKYIINLNDVNSDDKKYMIQYLIENEMKYTLRYDRHYDKQLGRVFGDQYMFCDKIIVNSKNTFITLKMKYL